MMLHFAPDNLPGGPTRGGPTHLRVARGRANEVAAAGAVKPDPVIHVGARVDTAGPVSHGDGHRLPRTAFEPSRSEKSNQSGILGPQDATKQTAAMEKNTRI